MNENVKKCLETMSERDFKALKTIYDYRCLTEEQIFNITYKSSGHLKKEVSPAYFKRKFKKWVDWGIIEQAFSYDRSLPAVYFLTTRGVSVVRRAFKFPANIYDETKKKVSVRGYQTSFELKVEEKFIPHQYNLNKFAIALSEICSENNIEFEYEDERHTSKYESIRPDGVLYTEYADFFLEMDMGTETEYQLKEKWNHYRTFKNSIEYQKSKKPIKIMFICSNVKKMEKRMRLVCNTISTHFVDLVDSNFDVYVGTHDDLVNIFKNSLLENIINKNSDNITFGNFLKNKFGLSVGKSNSYKSILEDDFMFFAANNSRVFAVDDFYGDPISMYNKISRFLIRKTYFESSTKIPIKYIIRTDSIERFSLFLDLFNVQINGEILITDDSIMNGSDFLSSFVTFIRGNKNPAIFGDMEFRTFKKVNLLNLKEGGSILN